MTWHIPRVMLVSQSVSEWMSEGKADLKRCYASNNRLSIPKVSENDFLRSVTSCWDIVFQLCKEFCKKFIGYLHTLIHFNHLYNRPLPYSVPSILTTMVWSSATSRHTSGMFPQGIALTCFDFQEATPLLGHIPPFLFKFVSWYLFSTMIRICKSFYDVFFFFFFRK